jgi:hypothetical protein
MDKIRIISLQISEEFVKEYNDANTEKKAQLDHQCMQIYEKLKVIFCRHCIAYLYLSNSLLKLNRKD